MTNPAKEPKRPPPYRLHPRRTEDLAPLVDLWVASWQATLPQIDFMARRQWFAAHVEAIENDGGVTICGTDRDGLLAGFLLLQIAPGHLEQLAVHPRHFGQGLAELLLDAAKARCPRGLTLDVNVDNPRALRFYAREGFRRIGEGTNAQSGLAIVRLAWLVSPEEMARQRQKGEQD
jgi:putative acetyltransferase